jgi:mono/diheme cytochrome c family protein
VLKLKIFGIFLFVAFAVLACSMGKAKRGVIIAEDKSLEASLFRQNCAICHGAEAEGKEMDGRVIPSLRRHETAQKSEQEIYNQISGGGNGMLPFKGQLSENEIRRMVKFVKYDLQGK